MCGIACGITTAVLGAALLLTSTIVGYGFMDGILKNIISDELILYEDTLQMERFAEIPFPLNFTIRLFNITNREDVLNGAIPVVNEVGPYIYKLHQTRDIVNSDEDTLDYQRLSIMEFDADGSYPNTEDDIVTIPNVPYHRDYFGTTVRNSTIVIYLPNIPSLRKWDDTTVLPHISFLTFLTDSYLTISSLQSNNIWGILQVAEVEFPELMLPLSLVLDSVFGESNSPIVSVRAREFFLDGIRVCGNPGLLGGFACSQIGNIAASSENMELQPDGSLLFSAFGYRDGIPSPIHKVYRGTDDVSHLGRIITYDHSYRLRQWPEGDEGSIDEHSPNTCNTIDGTDSGLYPPFLQNAGSISAFKSDICRSVELFFHSEFVLRGVPVRRFAVDERFLDNHQGCFCLNLTRGITGSDGCLLQGAQELYSCVGAFLVFSNPHFLYADPAYLNGVIGMTPDENIHRIWMDVEPNTGYVLSGAAKGQFNVFLRPISRISATSNLPNTLTPIFWIEEGLDMPEEYLDELKEKLLAPLRLVDILVPVLVAVSSVVLVLGVGLTVRAQMNKKAMKNN